MSHVTVQSVAAAAPAYIPAEARRREHIAYIEYFRAVAIILIVSGHTYAVAWTHFVDQDPQGTVSWLNIIPALITGGTAYFVFISGFLYRQVFYGRVGYGDFMRKKALYVGLPYLVLATPLALLEIGLGEFEVTFAKDGVAYARNIFVDFMVLISTGRVVTAYWYIPFVFLIFLASPLFDRFITMSAGPRAAVLIASIALALWVHRPMDNLDPVHSLLYLTNFYLLGILFCEYRTALLDFAARPLTLALLAALMLAIAASQAMILHDPGNLERIAGDGWAPLGLDLMLVQKYVGILFFCALLARWGAWLGRPLSFVAEHSFGLFFIHGIVIAVLMRLPEALSPHVGEPIADLAIYSLFVLAASMAIVVIAKKLTGRYSRYVIGC